MNEMIREKICTVTTLRAPVHKVLMFVNYHINIGIDHMILFFDDPNDMAIDALSGYKQVTSIKCDAQYLADSKLESGLSLSGLQRINANFGLKITRDMRYDWIIHIDSDELIYSEEPLKALLYNAPHDVHFLRFLPLEAVPEKMKYSRIFEEINLFKVLPTQKQKYLAYLLGCKKAFFKGDFLRGHLYGKSATRVSPDIAEISVHAPIIISDKKLRSYISPNAKLLHFDCCGFQGWKAKWLRRHTTLPSFTMRKNRECQFQEFVKLYKEGNDKKLEKLYNRLYNLSKFEKYILSKIGLLKQIYLNKELFKHIQQINSLGLALTSR